MRMYASAPTRHAKIRGKIQICEWCGGDINIGESYDKWISIDRRDRSTVYAHSDCADEWSSQITTGDMYSDDDPSRSERRPGKFEEESK